MFLLADCRHNLELFGEHSGDDRVDPGERQDRFLHVGERGEVGQPDDGPGRRRHWHAPRAAGMRLRHHLDAVHGGEF